ncbi:MAG: hypothetical protein JO166_11100 [Deltaproteobacteria bacterium]|nr:hypothetical protein [Deltaproteobacteria bacterium]
MSFTRNPNVERPELTPEYAAQFSAMAPLPGERERKRSRVEFLTNLVRQERFISPVWAIGHERNTGRRYRLDGQHSSYALSHLPPGVLFPLGLSVILLVFEFDSVREDGMDLFEYFNNPRSTRNNVDLMGLWRAAYPEIEALSREFLVRIARALNIYERSRPGGQSYSPRDQGMLYVIRDYRDCALWAAQFQKSAATTAAGRLNSSLLGLTGIVAEMVSDFIGHRDLAGEFWHHVFNQDHPDPNHETHLLAPKFLEMKRRRVGQADYRKRAQTAWRRYLRESTSREPVPEPPSMSDSPEHGAEFA